VTKSTNYGFGLGLFSSFILANFVDILFCYSHFSASINCYTSISILETVNSVLPKKLVYKYNYYYLSIYIFGKPFTWK